MVKAGGTSVLYNRLLKVRPKRLLPVANILLILVLMLGLCSSSAAHAAPKTSPALLEWSVARPNEMERVIVRQTGPTVDVKDLVARLGGQVTRDLRMIDALAVTLPARSIPALAQADGVRWVSLDAPLVSSQSGSTDSFTTWATTVGASGPALNPLAADFNGTPIQAGQTIWLSSVAKAGHLGPAGATVWMRNASVSMTIGNSPVTIRIPDAAVRFSPEAAMASSNYDAGSQTWTTIVPAGEWDREAFWSGQAYTPGAIVPGGVKGVTWSGQFSTDTPGVTVDWKWAAAVYSQFSADNNVLAIKPINDDHLNAYANNDKAGTPEAFRSKVVAGARGGGGGNYTGGYSGTANALFTFTRTAPMVDSALGPNGAAGCEGAASGAFGGFDAEIAPGHAIARVEAVFSGYVPNPLSNDLKIGVLVAGQASPVKTLSHSAFDPYVGSSGTVYLDITDTRAWQWGDFANGLQLAVDQSALAGGQAVCLDAVGLRVTATAGPDPTADPPNQPGQTANPIDTSRDANVYNHAIGASQLWNSTPMLQGSGVTVAVVDSGIYKTKDLEQAKLVNVTFNQRYHNSTDGFGHGTFVAGIIAGSGKTSNGKYVGVAPRSRLVNVRVSDDQGMMRESDLVAALQWVLEKKDKYNIRVVNLSLNSSQPQSYHTSPLDAACEILWFNGIVVVVSAGNNGTGNLYPPANDPFVITVGATDDGGTVTLADDVVAPWSAYGQSEDGRPKPDLVAPGTNVIGLLPDNDHLNMGRAHPNNRVDATYFRMSGTSVAAPIVSGAVALLLEHEPGLNPDQVKYRLKASAVGSSGWAGYDPQRAGAGYLNVAAAVNANTLEPANINTPASALLWTGSSPTLWGSVNWTSVNWTSVNWTSVNWTSVNWTSDHWDP
jgi:serine protease AprX